MSLRQLDFFIFIILLLCLLQSQLMRYPSGILQHTFFIHGQNQTQFIYPIFHIHRLVGGSLRLGKSQKLLYNEFEHIDFLLTQVVLPYHNIRFQDFIGICRRSQTHQGQISIGPIINQFRSRLPADCPNRLKRSSFSTNPFIRYSFRRCVAQMRNCVPWRDLTR